MQIITEKSCGFMRKEIVKDMVNEKKRQMYLCRKKKLGT